MYAYEPTERSKVRVKPARGHYDRELVHAILDEALTCHLGFVEDGQPFVVPTIHARLGERLYAHGSTASRALLRLGEGARCCLTVTLVDGLVLARSAKQHSLNYRSAMVFGTPREVTEPEEKATALQAVVDHIAPGRSAEIRGPSAEELQTTKVIALDLEDVSAKVREGAPQDLRADMELPVWAGELRVALRPGEAVPCPDLSPEVALPDYLRDWRSV